MNAYELADKLDEAADDLEAEKIFSWEERAGANMLRQQANRILELDVNLKAQIRLAHDQADRIAELEKEYKECKETNGRLVDLVQSHREEFEKMRQEILMWENAEVPTEVMADLIEELERRGFIKKETK